MKKRNGFTFVELLVVMAITGIIFAVTAVTYSGVTKSSRDARRKSDLESIRQALELCRSYSGSYPLTVTGGGAITCNAVTYMTVIPVDPKDQTPYSYVPAGTPPTSYTLSATLESTGDVDYPTYTVINP